MTSLEKELRELDGYSIRLKALQVRLGAWFKLNSKCPKCKGSGVVEVPNGPDDYTKAFCSCEYGRQESGERQ